MEKGEIRKYISFFVYHLNCKVQQVPFYTRSNILSM